MKTTATLACLTLALATLANASQANGQEFRIGPFSAQWASANPYHSHHGNDHGHITPQQPKIPDPGQHHRIGMPNPWETPLYVQPRHLEEVVFNPSTGKWQVKLAEKVINRSAADPNRDVRDPGSYHVSMGSFLDRNGNLVQRRTESWTSYGVPHSNSTERVIHSHGNLQVEEEKTVVRSASPNRSIR